MRRSTRLLLLFYVSSPIPLVAAQAGAAHTHQLSGLFHDAIHDKGQVADKNRGQTENGHNNPAPETKPIGPKNSTYNPQGQEGWSLVPSLEQIRFPGDSIISFYVSIPKSLPDAAADSGSASPPHAPDPTLTLLGSSLQDPDSKLSLPVGALYFCDGPGSGAAENCNRSQATTLDASARLTPRTLVIDPAFSKSGAFTGNLAFKLDNRPDVQVLRVTVYSRTQRAMWMGTGLIVLGLLLYLFVNVFLRQSIARNTALLAATELKETISTLQAKIKAIQKRTNVTLLELPRVLSVEAEKLTGATLQAKLPSVLPNPFVSCTDAAKQFSCYLNPISDRVAALIVLVDNGLAFAADAFDPDPTASKTAMESIDGLADSVKSAEDARLQLGPILQTLHDALLQPNGPRRQAQLMGLRPSFFSGGLNSTSIRMHLEAAAGFLWLIWALVATIGGFASLILMNYGFGSGIDYLKCFFWGLGFSVAGSQLQSLTQSSVSTTIGISVPKSN